MLHENEKPKSRIFLPGENIHDLSIALIEPEIPGNTGSIARTCVATNTHLIIVGPTAFEITNKHVKRAGLDYWEWLSWEWVKNLDIFLKKFSHKRMVFTSARTGDSYHEFAFKSGDILCFGKETMGIDKNFLASCEHCIRVPMWGHTRSLNLANCATTILYETYRQLGFPVTS